MSNLQKQLDKYYREINRNLPCKKNEKSQIIYSLKHNINQFIEGSEVTIEDIYAHFGTVDEITSVYYDEDNKKSFFIKSSMLKNIVIGLLVIFLCCFIFYIVSIFEIRSSITTDINVRLEVK